MTNVLRPALEDVIPVLRPLLPPADKLLPYLQRIDERRVYSNWGPLVMELTDRLGAAFGMKEAAVVCANSGTSALMAGILATAGWATDPRRRAIVPDFTFTATALAAQMCGYEPVLASCDSKTWSFEAADLLESPGALDGVGVVIPVAPFGRPVEQAPWLHFQAQTGIPVVIDGAACFETMISGPRQQGLGPLPVALSFHATKAFGIGEGGCVVTTCSDLFDRILRAMNFGFLQSRSTAVAGFNGKMPEYTAAVGLAELDGWDEKQRSWNRAAHLYCDAFASTGAQRKLWTAPNIASSYVLLQCTDADECSAIASSLEARGIDSRLWYGSGLHSHELFRDRRKVDLHGTVALDPVTLLGLPVAPDLAAQDIKRVCQVIKEAIARRRESFALAHSCGL
jgi:dTDP-4-amino-4,6-dideoxygalactose transaminase